MKKALSSTAGYFYRSLKCCKRWYKREGKKKARIEIQPVFKSNIL